MASEPIYGKGIVVASGFDLSAKSPLDTRSVVNTIAERDEHVSKNRAYVGMTVYVIDENKEYRYNGTDWIEILNDLSAVHSHTNKDVLDRITASDISAWNDKSDFSGSYNDLSDLPTIPTKLSDLKNDTPYATETYVLNKIAEAELNDKEIDLSGYVTKDNLANYATKELVATNYVTYTELENYQYVGKGYVDNLIATHEHPTMTENDANEIIKNSYK